MRAFMVSRPRALRTVKNGLKKKHQVGDIR